jgi:hypothetical protein
LSKKMRNRFVIVFNLPFSLIHNYNFPLKANRSR